MGNSTSRVNIRKSETTVKNTRSKSSTEILHDQSWRSTDTRSFGSIISQQSLNSFTRTWSRISRKRWKSSNLTLPLTASKTHWPISHIEAYFLPEFPLKQSFFERNFEILEFISHGSFGKVYKVIEKETGKKYALKVLAKSHIIKDNSVQQVKDEVQIQRVCGHNPFIVNCPFHWQTKRRLYIVSEFIEGGELFSLCEEYGIFPVPLVQIYVAEIALAIDFLHNAGVIYRDLKPENILLDSDGHIQLIDFGLAKWLPYGSKTRTICGTMRYIAPEVISLQPYGHSVDWWSLGVIACLMLTAKFPSPVVKSENSGSRKPGALPEDCKLDNASKDLLHRLLDPDPSRRLRSLRVLQTLAFFMKFDFEEIRQRKTCPKDILNSYFPAGSPKHYLKDLVSSFDDFSMDYQ